MEGFRLKVIELDGSDLEDAYKLDQRCFSKEVAFSREVFYYFLNSSDCACFGIKSGKKLIGMLIIQARTMERAQLVTIDISPEQRRKGIGERLLVFAENFLKVRGFKVIFLETAVDNHSAIALYQKLGYETIDIKKSYYPDGKDALLMEKRLQD